MGILGLRATISAHRAFILNRLLSQVTYFYNTREHIYLVRKHAYVYMYRYNNIERKKIAKGKYTRIYDININILFVILDINDNTCK